MTAGIVSYVVSAFHGKTSFSKVPQLNLSHSNLVGRNSVKSVVPIYVNRKGELNFSSVYKNCTTILARLHIIVTQAMKNKPMA